ncbi:heterogeneous nuclear ribonucleoprotein Q [Ditylenchus destructor]|nr:heterogeneous nuclear ribonucleoprotein Q [Ditylenchus destructor]
MSAFLEGVVEVIIYSSPDANESRKNRGFCFVDFVDHKAASDAKRRISQGKVRPWNNDLVVDWAEQQDEPDEETMATVRVLYVKNVKEVVTEEQLKEMFEPHGEVERAKKALEAMKGTVLEGVELDISLAKPQGDMKQKKKLALKRGGMGFGPMGGMMGRGGRFPAPDFYGPPGRGRGTGYPKFGQQQYGGFYGADAYGGYPPPAYGGYSMGPGYAPPGPAGRGGAGGFPRGAGGQARGGRGGFGGSPAGAARGVGGRGRGTGGRGGGKRPGGFDGGPASKRGGTDFAADISMNMF